MRLSMKIVCLRSQLGHTNKFLDELRNSEKPSGIFLIEAMDENHIFRIDYDSDMISAAGAIKYAHSLNL